MHNTTYFNKRTFTSVTSKVRFHYAKILTIWQWLWHEYTQHIIAPPPKELIQKSEMLLMLITVDRPKLENKEKPVHWTSIKPVSLCYDKCNDTYVQSWLKLTNKTPLAGSLPWFARFISPDIPAFNPCVNTSTFLAKFCIYIA